MSGRDDAREPVVDVTEPEPRPTSYEQMLVRERAGDVVERMARKVSRTFRRFVHPTGLMSREELRQIGTIALYRAARRYDPTQNPDFAKFAKYRVYGAMLDAVDALLFEERVRLTAEKAENNYLAYQGGDDYDVVSPPAEDEARRRFRAFANGQLAATFAAALEEAKHHLGTLERDERREYEYAIAMLQEGLDKLPKSDQALLALARQDLMDLKEAAERLGVPYPTARTHQTQALEALHRFLVDAGVDRLPSPLVVPEVGVLAARVPPQNDTDGR